VCDGVADCPQSSPPPPGGATDEQGCRSWSLWGPWSPCSTSCGPGSSGRQRRCPPGEPLRGCRGPASQEQPCFNTTCPGRGAGGRGRAEALTGSTRGHDDTCSVALQWTAGGCRGPAGPTAPADAAACRSDGAAAPPPSTGAGTVPRPRGPPTCPWRSVSCSRASLMGPLEELGQSDLLPAGPCPEDGCANSSCPPGLVRFSCGPCPGSCAHVSSGTSCDPVTCSPGQWELEGGVPGRPGTDPCLLRLLVSRGPGDGPRAAVRGPGGVSL